MMHAQSNLGVRVLVAGTEHAGQHVLGQAALQSDYVSRVSQH